MNGYRLIEKLPDGHRLFAKGAADPEDGRARIYIADESGATPDDTDDGVLWIDRTRALFIRDRGCDIPVTDGSAGSRSMRTPTDLVTAIRLAATYSLTINDGGRNYTVQEIQ